MPGSGYLLTSGEGSTRGSTFYSRQAYIPPLTQYLPLTVLMGMVRVPTKLYPWALMIVLQVMMKGEVSFMGHLAGAIVGILHTYGLTAPLLPSKQMLCDMEEWPGISAMAAALPNFKRCPPPLPAGEQHADSDAPSLRSVCKGIVGAIAYALTALWWVISAVLQIFGLYNPDPPPTGGWEAVAQGDVELGGRR
eukprot:TRINITY_DN50_c0_g1_i1.p1 TRINITY_DN50_c0_g1~~TRINITY_DN50_c0_g1_i1.p1  ORF type:complete len:193 (+),score=42.04 TRINITY_DN50_c0_g1_i1:1062-1640(+)